MQYKLKDIKKLIHTLSGVFDEVRLVTPNDCQVVELEEDTEGKHQEKCYRRWDKEERCENCTSLRACNNEQEFNKFEVNNHLYYVISKPLKLYMEDGSLCYCALEIIEQNYDDILMETFGRDRFIKEVVNCQNNVYKDPLTKVYNRRYFEEGLFWYRYNPNEQIRMAFIVADIKEFKQINDNYGHVVGDEVLLKAAQLMKSCCIEPSQVVIRMGGDEFLIVLPGCQEAEVLGRMNQIREQFDKSLIYDNSKEQGAIINLGYAYSSAFDGSKEAINKMYREADEKMYLDKKNTSLMMDF